KALVTVNGFLDTDYVELLQKASREESLDDLATIVVARGNTPDGAIAWHTFLERADAVDVEQARATAHAVRPDDLSDMLFTSGTTGHPKGVRTVHAQNLRAYRTWANVVGLRAGDRYLVVNPFFHAFGYKAGILAALMYGAA